ncbi:alpha/beta hydrolase [Streptosporangium lutulentum]
MGAFFGDLPLPFPVTEQEGQIWVDKFTAFAKLVSEGNRKLLPHISTADIARDMDVLREAVGDATLNYFGVSFGSLLGTTYANLFPGKVRAIALDGAIDPVNWFTDDDDPTLNATLRLGFDVSAARGVDHFLTLGGEAGPGACAFAAGDGEATRAKFQTLLERLRTRPVTLNTPEGPQTVTYPMVIANMWVALYQIGYWSSQAEILQELWLATERPEEDGPLETKLDVANRPGGTELPPLFAAPPEWSLALLGGDTPNPSDPQSWFAQGKVAEERAGGMGTVVNWGSVACASWTTSQNRYIGPWDRPTAAPILLIGTVGDPGTAYEGTEKLLGLLADAHLLTVDGEGHTAFYNPNPHVARALTDYFVAGVLPEPGATVPAAQHPFPS